MGQWKERPKATAEEIWSEIEKLEEEFDDVEDCNNYCFSTLRKRLAKLHDAEC